MLNRSRAQLLILAALVVLINLLLSVRYYNPHVELVSDERLYYELAETISQGNSWVMSLDEDIGARMAPGYSFVLGGAFAVFGASTTTAYVLNILFHIIITLCLFILMKKLTNKYFAWAFSVWLLLFYQMWRWNFYVMMEVSTVFFVVMTFFFFYNYIEKQKVKHLMLFGLFAGLLVFVNNRFVFHMAMVGFALGAYAIMSQKVQMKLPVFLGLGVLLVLLPWHIRQYVYYDAFVIFAPERMELISGANRSFSETHEEKKSNIMGHSQIYSYEEYLEMFIKQGLTQDKITGFTKEKYNALVADYENKFGTKVQRVFSRLFGFWSVWRSTDFKWQYGGDTRIIPPENSIIINLLVLAFLLPMFLLFPVGVFYSICNRSMFVQLIALVVFSHWLLHGWIHYIERYRITVMPLIFFVSFYGFYFLYQHLCQTTSVKFKDLAAQM